MIEAAAVRARAAKCICRFSFGCKAYPDDVACLFLGRAFKNADKEAEAFIEVLSVDEALDHARQAVDIGLVPTVVWDNDTEMFGEARNTGIAVCFCCDCCCDIRLGLRMGGEAFRKKEHRLEGVEVQVGSECDLCGVCAESHVCPTGAIALGIERAEIDLDRCVGCGQCIHVCPSNAIIFCIDETANVTERFIAQVKEVTDIT